MFNQYKVSLNKSYKCLCKYPKSLNVCASLIQGSTPVLVLVCPPTPGPSCSSLAKCLGVNYHLWRNNGGTLDGDQSGSEGRAGVSKEVRWVIWGTPPVIWFGSVPPLPRYSPAPPPYILEEGLAPM